MFSWAGSNQPAPFISGVNYPGGLSHPNTCAVAWDSHMSTVKDTMLLPAQEEVKAQRGEVTTAESHSFCLSGTSGLDAEGGSPTVGQGQKERRDAAGQVLGEFG